jgi:uncharacterized protein YjbI with pentapeptide repeats
MEKSIWKQTKAPGALFHGSRLVYANFSYADLTGASMEGADLEGATLHAIKGEKTSFKMANLNKVKGTDLDRYHAETWKPPPLPLGSH